jgi:hypothetical protein
MSPKDPVSQPRVNMPMTLLLLFIGALIAASILTAFLVSASHVVAPR